MATGEDQAQAIVGNLGIVELALFRGNRQFVRIGFQLLSEIFLPANPIDNLVAGSLNDPGGRRFRQALSAPLVDCRCEGLLRGIFGRIKITK